MSYPHDRIVLGVRRPPEPGDAPAVVDGARVRVYRDAGCTDRVLALTVAGTAVDELVVDGVRLPVFDAAETGTLYLRPVGGTGPGAPVWPIYTGGVIPGGVDGISQADADARYAPLAGTSELLALKADKVDVAAALAGKAALVHQHATGDVTGLAGYVDGRASSIVQAVVGAAPAALDTLQEIAAQLSSDESAVSALTGVVAGKASTTDPRFTDARTPLAHAHPTSDVTGLDASLASKVAATDPRLSDARAPLAHGHAMTDVAGLGTALASKVDTGDARLTPKTGLGYTPQILGHHYPSNFFSTGNAAPATGQACFVPFDLVAGTVYDQILTRVTTAQVAGSTELRVAIYPSLPSGGEPDASAGPLTSVTLTDPALAIANVASALASAWTVPTSGRYWIMTMYRVISAPTTAPQYACINQVAPGLWSQPTNGIGTQIRALALNGQTTYPVAQPASWLGIGATSAIFPVLRRSA